MKRTFSKLVLVGVLAGLLAGVAAPAPAQVNTNSKKADAAAAPAKERKQRVPFRGKIDSVDKTAKTLKVGERTFQITSTTKFLKAGKPAVFADVTVGEEVGGTYVKAADGKLELQSLRIGPKAPAGTKSSKKAKSN